MKYKLLARVAVFAAALFFGHVIYQYVTLTPNYGEAMERTWFGICAVGTYLWAFGE